jgi:zinc protease
LSNDGFKMKIYSVLVICLFLISPHIVAKVKNLETNFQVNYEKFALANGLEVVFHIDRSDPVVAVNLTAHVGSAREVVGRTGFAHLFEHLLFLESENLGKGGLDKLSTRIGGSGANGSTSRDRTNYLQTVPKDALEKMLWAEADKLGWFINTVTGPVLEKEKQVVKNEKRQGIDNRPYGHNWFVIDQNIYPKDHPYNWQVIGSLEDLQAATLDDVKQFFKRWYVPNNVTLTLAGDFDPVQAKKWVEKYFAEIKAGDKIIPLKKRPGKLTKTIKLFHEDNFANLPQITRSYPTVEQYHPDEYALNVLFEYLSDGKSAPLYNVLVKDKKLVPRANMFHQTSELAGQAFVLARAYSGKDLDDVNVGIDEALSLFEKEGMSEQDLKRILASQETNFYNRLSSVLGKGAQLAFYNIYTGDPGYAENEINAILSVTIEDVKRVYTQYIKNKPYVVTSFVPKGQVALAIEGSTKANVVEEKVVQGAEKRVDSSATLDIVGSLAFEKTPSTFDRSIEPPYGQPANVIVPQIWQSKIDTVSVFGIEVNEVPLVDFEIAIDGGKLLEQLDKVGVANMLAQMLTRGTKNKSPEVLENAIKQIGASIDVNASEENILIRVNTLAKNYHQAMQLVKEMLLEPRWDETEFTLLKQQTISQIRQQQANPRSTAANVFKELMYGDNSIRSKNTLGSVESVSSISLADLKAYYKANISPNVARVHVVGDISKKTVLTSMSDLIISWPASEVTFPKLPATIKPQKSTVYFYDIPNAKQTIVNIGYPALAATHADYYPTVIMNYILGGGSFASQLTQIMRESKGYTYGISSRFTGSKDTGTFRIFSQVRSNVTLESAEVIKQIMDDYAKNYSEQDLATSKSFLIKSNARAFETARAKLGLLGNISTYNWPHDYVKQREQTVKNMTVTKVKMLASQYLNSDQMIWLFVGDANTQLPRMKTLGFGEPVLLNP